jgi:hypothetical protein
MAIQEKTKMFLMVIEGLVGERKRKEIDGDFGG